MNKESASEIYALQVLPKHAEISGMHQKDVCRKILDGDTPELIAEQMLEMSGSLIKRNFADIWREVLNIAWREIGSAEDNGIRTIVVTDSEYPIWLKNSGYAVPVLFAAGERTDTSRSCALVGARAVSSGSAAVISDCAERLSEAGAAVISGAADGADTAAHRAALSARISDSGGTVAVMPCGLLKASAAICAEIMKGNGTLMSCFPSRQPIQKHQYFVRNSLIAGMSAAMIAADPKQPSGTSHAIECMSKLARPVAVIRDGQLSQGSTWDEILQASLKA